MKRRYLFLACLFLLEACSGGGGSSSQAVLGVLISPRPLAVQIKTTLQLSAKDLSGQSIPQSGLTWSVDGTSVNGTVNSNGLYSAPANIPPQNPVTLRAASVRDSTKNDAISFYILTGPTITFLPPPTDTLFLQKGNPASFHIAVFNQSTYVTWATTLAMGGTGLWYSKGDLNGYFSTPHNILPDLPNYSFIGATVENPVIAIDSKVDAFGDPGVYISWDDNSNSKYQVNLVKGPNGTVCRTTTPCFTMFALTGSGGATVLQVDPNLLSLDQTNPSLAINPLGKLEFAWSEVYSTSPTASLFIKYRELNSDGSAPTPSSIQIAPSARALQVNPAIGSDLSGNISASWLDFGGITPPNILYSRMVAGQSFSSPIPVELDTLASSDTFSMAIDYNGHPHLAWSKTSSNSPTVIYYSTTPDFLKFNTPVDLTSGGYRPIIKVDLLNYLYFTWDDGISSVYFKKIAPFPTSLALTNSPLVKTGVNPVMNIDDEGRVYLFYSTTGSPSLSTWIMRGE